MNSRPMLVEKKIKVNAYDIDVMGIVSNIVYVRWFEDLRFLLLDQFWAYEDMLKLNQSPILSKTEIDYKRPLTILDNPVGELWISDLNKSRWTISIEIKSDGKLVCCGKQTGYFYDMNRKRPVPIPQELLQKYQNCLEESMV
ncbi:acyl-CoA thioester hydrolase [Anaerocolumna jejuensis DSM 15929]|uniref:Acyl-CoA thioester hydrolase n=1 Tax=Anaerocolumna jejuensis DSM 15929 TaxID=1121322 RepID=A0A1M6PXA4_9FIRM|nr:thioesterase family protein [Anaerocolumna jejuensis]SHK12603.1 acyl-CoA thioester hydrolase [Anaerocolumna jejuensis DSM 15929]